MDSPIGSSRCKVKISIISLTKSTFIIAAQSPTGETGGGGGGTIGFLPCCLNIKQYIENINN